MLAAARPWAGVLSRAAQDLRRRAEELGVSRKVGAMLRLYQAYCLPAGMYGCQVWGTAFLDVFDPFASPIEHRRLSHLRCMLGLRLSTDRHVLLRETGSRPFQLYWFRACLRFFNKIRDPARYGSSPLMVDAVRSDLRLAGQGCGGCWAAEFSQALGRLEGGQGWAEGGSLRDEQLPEAAVMEAVEAELLVRPWGESALAGGTKRAAFVGLSGVEVGSTARPIPPFIDFPSLSRHGVKQVARLRTGSHNLRIERGRWVGEARAARVCERCSDDWCEGQAGHWVGLLGVDGRPVDDETHALLDCEATAEARGVALLDWGWFPDSAAELIAAMDDDVARFLVCCMDSVDDSLI